MVPREFWRTCFFCVAPTIAMSWTIYWLTQLPFPVNYFVSLIPLYIISLSLHKEMLRKRLLGFVYDRIREIPLEQQEKALEDYVEQAERERKRTRPL